MHSYVMFLCIPAFLCFLFPTTAWPATVDALASGGIAFAGLDVLAQEPPDPDNKLLGLPNVLLTPHTAGITRDTWTRRGKFVYENVDRVIRGEAPLSRVDGL